MARLNPPKFTSKSSAPKVVGQVQDARKTISGADGWTWLSWIGQAIYAVVYYGVVAVIATVVYGSRGVKAAAPHVATAARWTGRNTLAGAQQLRSRITGKELVTKPAKAQKPDSKGLPNVPAQGPRGDRATDAAKSGDKPRTPRSENLRAVAPPQKGGSPSSGGSVSKAPNSSSTGGSDMELFRKLKQLFKPVAQLRPLTAWELDFHLMAKADLLLYEAEVMSIYAETLDRLVGIDPRITRQFLEAVADMNSAVLKLHRTRRQYRQLYKQAFEAAERGRVRMPTTPGFWTQPK